MAAPTARAAASTPVAASATYSLSSIPALDSLPGAKAALYLDFVGDFIPQWFQYTNITIPAYDQDGDPTTFSDGELASITNIWQRVAEDYAPFNINVTTVPPPNFDNGFATRVDVGGDGAWYGGYNGISAVGSFTNSNPNLAFVFSMNLSNGDPKYTAEGVSHEAGHGFGLLHQSVWVNGVKTYEYNPGSGDGTAPIMGTSYIAPLSRWWYGTSDVSATTYQDDMAVIASSTNGFGYRPAPPNMTAAAAAPLAVSGASVSGSGIIRLPTDLNYFSFTTGAGQVSLSALVQTGMNNLVPRLELRDSTGSVLIASAGPDANDNATITTTLPAGKYRLVVADSDGLYGNVGQYTIGGTIVPATDTINPPTNLTATAVSTSRVNLAWTDKATNETGYTVERSTDGLTWGTIATGLPAGSTSFSDTAASPGTTYNYLVYAYNASSTSDNSNLATATTVPVAPAGLTATAASSVQINLNWGDVTGETGFRIERSPDGVNWNLAGTTGANVTSYQDTSVAAGMTYQYRVEATDAGGASACSNVASATAPASAVPPAAPSGLVAVAGTGTSVTLTWQDSSGNESGFLIERSNNNGKSWTQIGQVGANVTSYADTTVNKNKSYFYRVRAYNASGYSAYSNVASVTTPAKAPSLNLSANVEARPSHVGGGILAIAPPAALPPHSPVWPVADWHQIHRRPRTHEPESAHDRARTIAFTRRADRFSTRTFRRAPADLTPTPHTGQEIEETIWFPVG